MTSQAFFQSVVFGFVTDRDEGKSQGIGDERSLWDGTCGHASHGLHFGEVCEDGMGEFEFHIGAKVGVGERLAVVAVEG